MSSSTRAKLRARSGVAGAAAGGRNRGCGRLRDHGLRALLRVLFLCRRLVVLRCLRLRFGFWRKHDLLRQLCFRAGGDRSVGLDLTVVGARGRQLELHGGGQLGFGGDQLRQRVIEFLALLAALSVEVQQLAVEHVVGRAVACGTCPRERRCRGWPGGRARGCARRTTARPGRSSDTSRAAHRQQGRRRRRAGTRSR